MGYGGLSVCAPSTPLWVLAPETLEANHRSTEGYIDKGDPGTGNRTLNLGAGLTNWSLAFRRTN